MKKILVIFAFLLFSIVSISAQNINGKEIRNRDVEWSDFTGEVDRASKFAAWTYWVTSYSFPAPKIYGNGVRVNISVRLFLRADSWVRPGKQTARLLNHERGHYRIGMICANEIEQTINSKEFSKNNYHKEIDAIYWQIIEKYKALGKQYDAETNHFNNQEQQKIWDKKIYDLLSK